jgi:hypothetical protein
VCELVIALYLLVLAILIMQLISASVTTEIPHIMVYWLPFLLRFRDRGSNLDSGTVCSDSDNSWYSSTQPGKCWDSNLN